MQFGIIGSGSWATALAKILTDNHHTINWCVRSARIVNDLYKKKYNPDYLSSVHFDPALIRLYTDINLMLEQTDCAVVAIPSAYAIETLSEAREDAFSGKKIVSAIKGVLPEHNQLLSAYLESEYGVPAADYFTLMGPCHAEEVAREKLSYLTFSGIDNRLTDTIASAFTTDYLNTVVNDDVTGVQFAAVLKNIYALGAGIAHGLEYGDNFQSVLIANCADEMVGFLKRAGSAGNIAGASVADVKSKPNYAASVYLGDLLVTCYSLFSRNRSFGNMIGKGYTVSAAKMETNMVAEGYTASKCIHHINKAVGAAMPIADAIYAVLWENLHAREGFRRIEKVLV